MKLAFFKLFFLLICFSVSASLQAADKDDAINASKNILNLLRSKQYEKLWNLQTSEAFKKNMTKNSFLANMTMGRQQLGELSESKLVDMAYSQKDPASGMEGEIYAFNYLNTYTNGNVYERIVVLKEKDGLFRLAGVWGAPAAK